MIRRGEQGQRASWYCKIGFSFAFSVFCVTFSIFRWIHPLNSFVFLQILFEYIFIFLNHNSLLRKPSIAFVILTCNGVDGTASESSQKRDLVQGPDALFQWPSKCDHRYSFFLSRVLARTLRWYWQKEHLNGLPLTADFRNIFRNISAECQEHTSMF